MSSIEIVNEIGATVKGAKEPTEIEVGLANIADIAVRIAEYIVKKVQEDANPDMGGYQMVIDCDDITEIFGNEINREMTILMENHIANALWDREEVVDVEMDDGFDVVLYTDHAPLYKEWASINLTDEEYLEQFGTEKEAS